MNALLATLTVPLASLSVSVADGEALPVIQLTPDGTFAARDGRPGNITNSAVGAWTMTADIAAAVLNIWKQRATSLVIDYEHQTLRTRENGQPAPAAGWIENLSYEPGRGLLAAVRWTRAAAAHIRADEYRYISPTFTFNPKTGAVLELRSAALTNTPALDGLPPVAASETFLPENTMSLEKRVKELLGLPADAPDTAVEAALSETLNKAALPHAASPPTATPDPAQFAPMAALTDLQAANEALRAKMESLTATQAATEHNRAIDAALADGRLSKATESWAREQAKANPEALTAFLRAAMPVAALTTMQTGGVSTPGASLEVSLSADEIYACKVLGMTEGDFIASKKENK